MPNTDDLNRTIFISDNLPFLQSLDSESVDLVIIDPPFGKKRTFAGEIKPPLTAQERERERERMDEWGVYDAASAYELGVEYPDQSGDTALFKDIWRFERVMRQDWWGEIQDTPLGGLIESTRRTHGDDIAAYIAFMGERTIEIRRVLKPRGSVYLHCDHTANAYLRQMMDAVFGVDSFRNEIIWAYTGPSNPRRWFPRKHDTILFYAKTDENLFNRDAVRIDYKQLNIQHSQSGGGGIGGNLTPDTVDAYREKGKVPEDYWLEDRDKMSPVGRLPSERTGYPTQKPQSLARRMILASSDPGDIVLDCFAGCAYVPVAAEETERRWIACDMSPRAFTVVRRQFAKKPELGMTVEGEEGEYEDANPRFEGKGVLRTRGPNQLPARTDEGVEEKRLPLRSRLPEIKFRQKPLESGAEIWQAFVQEWGTDCWYCGLQQPEDRRYLQLDHVEPNKGDGTNDDCWNRALACIACNSDKSDRLTPSDTMDKALAAGRIQTQARRDEISAAFVARREWARRRYESLPKAEELALDS